MTASEIRESGRAIGGVTMTDQLTATEIREALALIENNTQLWTQGTGKARVAVVEAARAYADLLEKGEKVYFAEKVAMPDSDSGDDAIWTFIVPGSYLIVHLGGESP